MRLSKGVRLGSEAVIDRSLHASDSSGQRRSETSVLQHETNNSLQEFWLHLPLRLGLLRSRDIPKARPDRGAGVDPLPWTVHGYGGSGQFMVQPFVFDGREVAQRRVAA